MRKICLQNEFFSFRGKGVFEPPYSTHIATFNILPCLKKREVYFISTSLFIRIPEQSIRLQKVFAVPLVPGSIASTTTTTTRRACACAFSCVHLCECACVCVFTCSSVCRVGCVWSLVSECVCPCVCACVCVCLRVRVCAGCGYVWSAWVRASTPKSL